MFVDDGCVDLENMSCCVDSFKHELEIEKGRLKLITNFTLCSDDGLQKRTFSIITIYITLFLP